MSAVLMITAFQEFHGAIELYWYPGTSVMSENRRFGWVAADDGGQHTANVMKNAANIYFFALMTDIICIIRFMHSFIRS